MIRHIFKLSNLDHSTSSLHLLSLSLQALSDRLSLYISAYTLYSSVRPFGASTILAGIDQDGPSIYMIEPSGVYWGYHGTAIGKGRQLARTEIEKLNLGELSCEEGVDKVAEM